MNAHSQPVSFRQPRIRIVADFSRVRSDAIVAFIAKEGDRPLLLSESPEAARHVISAWLSHARAFKGEEGEIVVLSYAGEGTLTRIALAGVGDVRQLEYWRIERAAATAAKALSVHDPSSIAWPLKMTAPAMAPLNPALLARHVARGAVEGPYRFQRFHSRRDTARTPEIVLYGQAGDKAEIVAEAESGALEGDTLNVVADLANLPGNVATPEYVAKECRRLARAAGLSCRVYDAAALKRERCQAWLAVAAGSRREPRLIVLRHGRAERKGKPIVLVGKTLTFDTGGISLKPSANMEWMRYDKCGGMAVLAALLAAARLKLSSPVIGLLAAAENMPDGGATRPGDIVRARSGKTIEIVNTDAEGRMVLADALSFAAVFNPSVIVDVATLTGAARIALGEFASALCTTDEALTSALVEAGRRSGDRVWPLPLWPEYGEMLKTPFADLKNAGDGSAGTIAGAAFLRAFIPDGLPWAHLDIAARAWLEKEKSHRFPGATLAGARLLIEWLKQQPYDTEKSIR